MNNEQLINLARRTAEIQRGDCMRIKTPEQIRNTGVGLAHSPSYTSVMQQYSGTEAVVGMQHSEDLVSLRGIPYTWHKAWLERIDGGEHDE